MLDTYGRIIDYVRISVTDRCNLRCVYCMPAEGVPAVPHCCILTYNEIERVCKTFANLGVKKIKLTGGEPLVRKNIAALVRGIKNIDGIEEVTLTTNGTLLEKQGDELAAAGIDSINVSLDTLVPDKFKAITRGGDIQDVLVGIRKMLTYPEVTLKVNCVPNHITDQEILDIVELARNQAIHVRFIELMPIGTGKTLIFDENGLVDGEHAYQNSSEVEIDQLDSDKVDFDKLKLDKAMLDKVVTDIEEYDQESRIRTLLEEKYGTLKLYESSLGNGPSVYYSIENFVGKVGFISAMSHKFCHKCNRIRLTAEGYLKTCLQYDEGVDLFQALREEKSEEEVETLIREAIYKKPKAHQFHEEGLRGGEKKSMSQIGG